MSAKIIVKTPSHPSGRYPIIVGENILPRLKSLLPPGLAQSRPVLLVDENVLRLHRTRLEKSAKHLGSAPVHSCPAGESAKTFASLSAILEKMIAAGYGRDTLLIIIGGGAVGDAGAFLASIYNRGIPFIQVPTTLLSMVDSSVGGKTAINFQNYKNMLGTFAAPQLVLADLALLKTLAPRQLASGLAESLKHGLIGDQSLIQDLARGQYQTPSFIERSIKVKVRVVEKDFQEIRLRKILNLGHTVAHALESYFLDTPNHLLHGEAVGLGLLAELKILQDKKIIAADLLPLIRELMQKVNLPVALPAPAPAAELWRLAQKDKKNRQGRVIISRLFKPYRLPRRQIDPVLEITEKEFRSGLKALK